MGMERESEESSGLREEWLAVPANLRENGTATLLPERRARLWSLVLEARYLPFHIEKKGGGVILLVPARSFAASLEELRLFEKENRGWPPFQPLPAPMVENTLATLSVLILLATFYNLTLLDIPIPGHHQVDWVAVGNAHAGKIVDGEWWRLITALTLHADWLHLISNLSIGGLFIVFLCRELGSGLAWSLLLASGILGNLANAFIQQPDHRSVGASTLVFGAVGILGAISVLRYRKELRKRWPLPIAAAMALLALLGTEGKQTDLGAHLFGFLFGIILGLIAEILTERFGRPSKWLNASLAFLSALLILFAWWSAILNGGNG
jgi:membrane associated rhomboid family serine protease